MKSSIYNIYVSEGERKFVFNTFSSAICELDDKTWRCLQADDRASIDDDELGLLREDGFVVAANRDELSAYLSIYESDKNLNGELYARLLLTTACNLDCLYCYQGAGAKRGPCISPASVDAFSRFIESTVVREGISSARIDFYGGEPTLAKQQLYRLFANLESISVESSCRIEYSIVTNGTLLDDELAAELVKRSAFVQITVDGPKSIHDSRRISKSGISTFGEVISGIRKLIALGGGKRLSVGVNLDHDNIDYLEETLVILREAGVTNVGCGAIDFACASSSYCGRLFVDDEREFAAAERRVRRILAKFGFSKDVSDVRRRTVCAFHCQNAFVIDPELRVFKCDALIDRLEYSVGQIDHNGLMNFKANVFADQVSRSPLDFVDCITCSYLPICGAGCPIRALNSKGSLNASFCDVSSESIRQKVLNHIEL